MILALTLLTCLPLSQDGEVTNAGFEERSTKAAPVPGWALELGAQNGAVKPESTVEVDRKQSHRGRASLRFSGDRNTRGWIIAKQPITVRPGGKYELSAWTRTAGVEPNGFGLDNCYVGLVFFDAEGKVTGRKFTSPDKPDSAWTKQTVAVVAAPHAREGYVYLFLSMLGDLWVDDLELKIEGGEELAAQEPLELIHREDFSKGTRVPSKWKKELGATSGTGGGKSQITLDAETGAQGSPGSLSFQGDVETFEWQFLYREFKAKPGELWRLRSLVKAQDVCQQGQQFRNLHVNLSFTDRRGAQLGSMRVGNAEPGTHDWEEVTVEALSPEGTAKVRAGMFLSMSGQAWFDDVELSRREGVPIPYGDWETIDRDEIVLRYAADHPKAGGMRAYAVRLEQARSEICRRLDVEFEQPITVFIYKDLDEGRLLTGATLDFADPENRRVHQQLNSYIAHEMVHVIAHTKLTYSGTTLIGEGIAVWLNGQPENRHHSSAAALLAKGELPSVRDLLDRFRELDVGYPAGGSFVGYLIQEHGLEVFKQLYPLEDPSTRLKELKGVSFEDMEPGWHELLRKYD